MTSLGLFKLFKLVTSNFPRLGYFLWMEGYIFSGQNVQTEHSATMAVYWDPLQTDKKLQLLSDFIRKD